MIELLAPAVLVYVISDAVQSYLEEEWTTE